MSEPQNTFNQETANTTSAPTSQTPSAASPASGIVSDITTRLQQGDREMVAGVVCCGLAVLQFFIGQTGGAFVTTALFMNLVLIGWLANTGYRRLKANEGRGLFTLTGIA